MIGSSFDSHASDQTDDATTHEENPFSDDDADDSLDDTTDETSDDVTDDSLATWLDSAEELVFYNIIDDKLIVVVGLDLTNLSEPPLTRFATSDELSYYILKARYDDKKGSGDQGQGVSVLDGADVSAWYDRITLDDDSFDALTVSLHELEEIYVYRLSHLNLKAIIDALLRDGAL